MKISNPLDGLPIHDVKLLQMAYLFGRITHEVIEPINALKTAASPNINTMVEGQREAAILLMGDLIRAMREAERWTPKNVRTPALNFYEQVCLRRASTQGGQANHYFNRGKLMVYEKVLSLWREIVDDDTMMYPEEGIQYKQAEGGR